MPSAAQIRANRANSARSTGPRTAKGIAASSSNALRHGLTAQQHLIGDEDEGQFEALLAGLNDSHQPANAAESILVAQIAEHYWRLMRARRIETGFWEKRLATNNRAAAIPGNERYISESPEQQLAHIFDVNDSGMFDRLMRYEASIERSYYRAIKQLEDLQLTRRKAEKPIGFVSQRPVAIPIRVDNTRTETSLEPTKAPEPTNASQPRQNEAVAQAVKDEAA
jgi:hypothetical protein